MLAPTRRRPMTIETGRTRTPDQLSRAEQKFPGGNCDAVTKRRRRRLDSATLAKLDQALTSIDRTGRHPRSRARHPNDPCGAIYADRLLKEG